MEAMAKHQQKWEKKKEKMEKKSQTERGSARKSEKDHRKMQKEETVREQKEDYIHSDIDKRIGLTRTFFISVILVLYSGAIAMMCAPKGHVDQDAGNSTLHSPGDGKADDLSPRGVAAMAAVPTSVMAVALATVVFACERRRHSLIEAAKQREAVNLIKGSLERKQTEKEREEQAKERRILQQKEFKERQRRRAEEEAAALSQAKELTRALRRRREEREAEQKRVQAQRAAADDGERDANGWTRGQHERLQNAVRKYPDGWSVPGKKRWEMIACEVGGQDARACRETFLRLEKEPRNATITAPMEGGSDANANTTAARDLEDDFDWLEGGLSEESLARETEDDEDEDDDEDENEQEERERMAVEVQPEHKGTEVRLEGIKVMQGCATVQLELLHLQLSCADCRTCTRFFLSGADADAADAKTWCEGCSGLIAVHLRPTLLHQSSTRLCYVDCVRCIVTDMLPSVLMSVCATCDAPNVHKQEFSRNRVITGTCFSCHSKYGFGAESIRIEQVTPCESGYGGRGDQRRKASDDGDEDPMDEVAEELRWLRKKAKSDPRQQLIQLGKPLPQIGACKHFKKSFKWYRFACCGRAFPCPQCHIESACPAAALGAFATRQICGKCSMEQTYSPARPCEKCGFSMQAKGSSHWDDGAGTRNLTVMSNKDAKKFKGGLGKCSSAKASRVGATAKAKREHARKFGKDG